MLITLRTTEAEILAPIQTAREALIATAHSDRNDSETLAGAVNAVAAAEGRAEARYTLLLGLQAMESGEATPEQVRQSLLDLLLRSPNDTWSGRANDARRARADGLRDEVRRLVSYPGNKMYAVA